MKAKVLNETTTDSRYVGYNKDVEHNYHERILDSLSGDYNFYDPDITWMQAWQALSAGVPFDKLFGYSQPSELDDPISKGLIRFFCLDTDGGKYEIHPEWYIGHMKKATSKEITKLA